MVTIYLTITTMVLFIAVIILIVMFVKQRRKCAWEISSVKEEYKILRQQIHEKTDQQIHEAVLQAERVQKQARLEATEAEERAARLIAEEKARSERELCAERERIVIEENKLAALPEKELLARALMILAGYGSRLDRMEVQRKTLHDGIKKDVESIMRKECAALLEPFQLRTTALFEAVEQLKCSVETTGTDLVKTREAVYDEYSEESVIGRLSDMSSRMYDIGSKLDEIESQVSWARSDLRSLESEVQSVHSDMSSIQSDTSDIKSDVSSWRWS